MSSSFKSQLNVLGFSPKDGAVEVYQKEYKQHNYSIEVDFSKEKICYGDLIGADCKTTQNFSQAENWVVLECVNRLLEKGYKPQNIILEKTWPAGHGTSGRLDICVNRDDGSEYLLIECKTYGKEFNKAVSKLNKDGGQLFTYFKFSNKADVIMLYASELQGDKLVYRNEIVKIEDDYRVGNVKDFYDKWNKLTKDNGIFETWVRPYCFESKALTIDDLKKITQEDSSFIFNRFLEILRHNVVSDKGNAFNKIFTLFLCKVYDETTKIEGDGQELDFQWKEGIDNDVDFQLRLTDLYKKGMEVFLSRIVSDFNENDFQKRCNDLNDETKKYLLYEVNKLRLEKNNEFAFKEVYDHDSFEENAKIVKEVVELLQGYRIRYNKRQQYLSDFFELLLTTGLKQEAGQFFTPVPIAQFIIKSLPLEKIVDEKLKQQNGEILPYMIDYAAGSGHFITEYMHEVQNIIEKKSPAKYIASTRNNIQYWQTAKYEWATNYVYGIEKDYRLVKVGKVGCYLHGDGLANVILSDGLGNFVNTKDYKGKLHKDNDDNSKDNQQFDIILSNPPYSVSAFRQTTRDYYTNKDFDLYDKLTDNSSEIECLFVERTKQLLKDGGVAGIILPSSILTNTGIYTKTRELLLKYFEIVGITELGSNTFMATGTNTVVLFLRRRNNYECINLEKSVDKFFSNHTDVTINAIETPIAKYVNYVWKGLSFDDYLTLLDQNPNDKVKNHDLFKEYSNKIKTDKDFWNKVIEIEKEKIYYFILCYPQRLVIVKTGEKEAEKQFLGYEFSNRRGAEGIHAIQRNKSIDECTKLFDINSFDNPQKASTYIHKAFENDFDFAIDETLKDNVSRANLLDMMTFDRVDFEKNINLNSKKKVKIESKWDLVTLDNVASIDWGNTDLTKSIYKENGQYKVYSATGQDGQTDFFEYDGNAIILSAIGARCGKCFRAFGKWTAIKNTIVIKNKSNILLDYLYEYINDENYWTRSGKTQPFITLSSAKSEKIPLPPLDIQQKIVDEIEEIEQEVYKNIINIEKYKNEISHLMKDNKNDKLTTLGDISSMKAGKFVSASDISIKKDENLYPCYGGNGLRGYVKSYNYDGNYSLIGRQGALCGNVCFVSGKFHATEHAVVVTPNQNIDTKWLYYKLIYLNLNQYAKGTAQPGLAVSNILKVQINVPNIKYQQKIVSQIEEFEKQIAEAQKVIDNSKQQKQAILDKYLK